MVSSSSSDNQGSAPGDNINISPHPIFKAPYGTAVALFPHVALGLAVKTVLGITTALYLLNQSHLLPKPLAAVVSKVLFYPSLPITASKRIGNWVTQIDKTVVIGGAPFGFLSYPQRLKDEYGVKGVINMCEEWRGPVRQYKKLGIDELWLPTVDHIEPSQEDLISAVSFIKRHEAQGNTVYVHCRAGHGRSGATVFAWMLYKNYPVKDPQKLNADLRLIRKVRPNLWKQPNVRALYNRLITNKGSFVNLSDDFFQEEKFSKSSIPSSTEKNDTSITNVKKNL